MPDAQGVSSFIGEFMKGYMGKVAQMEQDKVRNVAGLMDVADQYRKMMETATSDEVYQSAQENYQQKVAEADKLMNQKVSGLSSIMGMLGLGKKGKNGQAAMIPREWAATQPQEAGQAAPAPMERPAALGPEPPAISPLEDTNIPPEFRGMQQFMNVQAPTPATVGGAPSAAPSAAPAPVNEYAGIPIVQRNILRAEDARRNREREETLALEERRQGINRRYSREDYEWRAEQEQADKDRRANAYRASAEFGNDSEEDARVLRNIQFGIPYREPTLRTSTAITRNPSGQLVRRTTDLRTKEVISEEPYYASADEPKIQAIIQEERDKGRQITPDEAVVELGRRELQEQNLRNQTRTSGLKNQADIIAARRLRTEMLRKASTGGGLDAKDARSLYQSAMSFARATVTGRPEHAGDSEQEIMNAALPIARQWIEDGGMSWEKIQSLLSGNPEKTPEQELGGYRPPSARTSTGSTSKAGTYNFKK